MKVYFIPGLGADKRVFQFLDLSFCEPVFVDWLIPNVNETLQQYALRLNDAIPEPNPVLVGVSFGGMLATEMAKFNPAIRSVIISSSKTYFEIPAYLRMLKHFPVYQWLPHPFMHGVAKKTDFLFSTEGREQKKIQQQIMFDTDMPFNAWAVHAIVNWRNTTVPLNITHIHGTKDKMLPYRNVTADYTIKNGRHLMVMDHAAEISALLKRLVTTSN